MKIAALVAAAEDLNKVLGLDPAIEVEDATEEDLIKRITEEADAVGEDGKPNGVMAKDKLKDATWDTLAEMGVAEAARAERDTKKAKASKPKAEKPKKGKEAGVAKKESKPKAKAEKPKAEKPKAEKPKKETKPKAEKTPRYTRDHAFAAAIKSGVKDEAKLIEKADELYQKATGAGPNPKESKWTHNKAMGVLKALGLVEVEDGKVNYKG